MLALNLNFSPHWLVLNEGEPFSSRKLPENLSSPDWKEQFQVIYRRWTKKAIRDKSPISVTAFGRDFGLSHGRAQGWEKGQLPNADDLEKLARRLHISPDWLLLGIGEPFEDRAESESIPPVVPALPVPPEAMQVTGLAQCGVEGWECTRRMAVTTERLPGLGPDAVAVLPVGDSMLPEGIREGFVCYCDPSREPEIGDAVYVEQADGTATIKLWRGQSERTGFIRLTGWLPRRGEGVQRQFDIEILQSQIKRAAPVVYVKRRM
jgi:hypothetical protein